MIANSPSPTKGGYGSGPNKRRPQDSLTKGEDPSEGAEPIAAVVEDIEEMLDDWEVGKGDLMGKEENAPIHYKSQRNPQPCHHASNVSSNPQPCHHASNVSSNPQPCHHASNVSTNPLP